MEYAMTTYRTDSDSRAVADRPDSEALHREIDESDARFVEAFNRGDLDGLETLHADDAVLLAPDSPPVGGGSEASVEGFRELWDAGWRNMSLDSVEIGSNGDLAYHYGKVGADVPTGTNSTTRVEGKYVDIYNRGDDGSWKIHLTIFNMDGPMPT